jgi:hypothetical protein
VGHNIGGDPFQAVVAGNQVIFTGKFAFELLFLVFIQAGRFDQVFKVLV